jgi:hypothetical protein
MTRGLNNTRWTTSPFKVCLTSECLVVSGAENGEAVGPSQRYAGGLFGALTASRFESRISEYLNKTRTVVALSRTTKNHAGDKIKVVYDPEDPTEVSLGGKEKIRQDGGFPVLSVLFGLASTAAGFLWIARSGDRRA